MTTQENAREFSPEQMKYIQFLAAGKVDTAGNRWSKEDFARKVLKMDPATLYRWQQLPGFKAAVFEATMGRVSEFIPDMIRAQVHKSIKKQDTQAFMALMRQTELLKSDRIENKNETVGELKISFDA